MKSCGTCAEVKPLDDFSPDARASDGRQAKCRDCCNRARREAYVRNTEVFRQKRRSYYAKNTDRVKEINNKSRDKNKASIQECKKAYYRKIKDTEWYQEKSKKRRERTKDSKRQYDADYRAANAEKLNARIAEWRAKNSHKVRAIKSAYKARRWAQESVGASSADVAAWLLAQEKVCYWCDAKCSTNYHVDHYHPLSKGGKHEIHNLVVACASCNLRKNAKDPYEFAKQVGRLF